MSHHSITRSRLCPVCGESSKTSRRSRTSSEWKQCTACGTWVFESARRTKAYPANYYGGPAAKFSGWAQRMRTHFHRSRAQLVRRWTSGKKIQVYDVGCGDGLFLWEAKKLGFKPMGFEPEPFPRKQAAQQLGKDLDQKLFHSLGAEMIPAITCWQVIEHVANPRSFLNQCHRQLKTGGILALSTVNRDSIQSKCFGSHWLHLDPPRHLWVGSLTKVAEMVEASGFRIICVRHNPMEFGPVGWVDSFFNLMDSKRDRLLHCLKLGFRDPQDWVVWVLAAGLTPLAIVLSLMESWLNCPATFEIYARAERKGARRQGG